MRVDIRGDVKEFSRQMDRIQRRVLPAAIPSAINKTIAKINTQSRREIAQVLGIPQKAFKGRMKVYRATYRRPEGKNWIGTRVTIPVAKVFKSSSKQIAYTKQTQGLSPEKIFSARMPGGHEGIFYRLPKAANSRGRDRKGRPKRQRLPIQEVAIDLSKVAVPVLAEWARRLGRNKFRDLLIHEIRFRLSKQ